ncbi:MAG: GNAT family N-acetyltransferase [Thermoplasmata archaeon]|nr:GNAT family N-acetyltransferase [Thermoplasmata archaeon]
MGLAIRVMELSDIPGVVELQAIVWQDHFLKERNMQVPIMKRTRRNMEYYLAKDPGGCFVAMDGNRMVGTIVSHTWGSVGWFGPLEVNPVIQGTGIGKALVTESIKYLRSRGCTTVGCETMASSARNIAFYNKLGFKAMSLSHVLYKRLGDVAPEEVESKRARRFQPGDNLDEYKALWNNILPGLDYSVEIASTIERELGHIWVMDEGHAHAIVHTYEMFEESQNAIMKLLVAEKGHEAVASELLDRCEIVASMEGKTGMFIRTYDVNPPVLKWFFERGYELQGTSIRLILDGPDETDAAFHVSCWSG